MTCTNCALSVEKTLKDKGASDIDVDFMSGEVRFHIDDEQEEGNFRSAINASGFKVLAEDEVLEQDGIPRVLWIETICTIPLVLHMFVHWSWLSNPYLQWALASVVLFLGIRDMGAKAIRSIQNRMPSMEVLVMIGSISAYIYSLIGLFFFTERVGDFLFFETAALIITLVTWGHYLEHRSMESTTKAIRDLMQLKPEYAQLVWTDSLGKESIQKIQSQNLKLGDIIQLREGENIGADGRVLRGEIWADERMLTGESLAVPKKEGDLVYEGTSVQKGNARVEVTNVSGDSALSKIIDLVKSARSTKPNLQKLADRIAAIFVPVVVVIAVVTFIANYYLGHFGISESLMRSIAVLVISCPCAMGIATPAAVMVGLGIGSKRGVLVRNGSILENLSDIRTFIFDKTGTLTSNEQNISINNTSDLLTDSELEEILYTLESHSSHPIAESIRAQVKNRNILPWRVEEVKGKGIQAQDESGKRYRLGSAEWLGDFVGKDELDSEHIYLGQEGALLAEIDIQETITEATRDAIYQLQSRGYDLQILSGDSLPRVQSVASELGIENFHAKLSPEDKQTHIREAQKKGAICMVGDGINDAPALALADVSVSLSAASDIAQNTADVILLGSDISRIAFMIDLGRATFSTIKGNLFWAFIYNIIAIPVAAFGYLDPSWGAGVMALSDVFLVLNSLRLRYRNFAY